MNVADSDFIAGCFAVAGYEPCDNPENADVIVVNTCTVRQHAEDRALSYIGTLKKLRIKNKKLKIFIVGCVASRIKEWLKKKFPFIDEVIPATDIEKFPQFLSVSEKSVRRKFSEFVTISRGCSNYCSYCIVPYVRGPEMPRSFEAIVSEVENLVNSGIKKVILLGQNVNSYSYNGIDFADLLVKVCGIESIKKIGFMTNHPKDMSDKIIRTVAEGEKFAKHFHLPVQSGSDRILKSMNRGYTKSEYMSLIDKIRKLMPGASITTDVMVGFPSETEEDFSETLSLMRAADFDNFFAFKYSPREGTAAYKMEDDVPQEVKEERLAKILEMQKPNIKQKK